MWLIIHARVKVERISLFYHSITAMFFYGWPTVVFIIHLSHGSQVVVNRRNEGLLTVPQDEATNVTYLILEDNKITHIDYNSFRKYTELRQIHLSRNPLKNIANGTFANNHRLSQITCKECAIESAPTSFGPCTSQIRGMNFAKGIVNSNVLLNLDFIKFSRLEDMRLLGLAISDLNVLQLPPSIRLLYVIKAGISTLPQVGHTRLPTLTRLGLPRNKLRLDIPYSWFENISINIRALNLAANGIVKLPEILPVKPHLYSVVIDKNRLLTIPDMLDFPALTHLFIRKNPVICDRKMCWRRLWDRKRAPLIGDDVMCQMPPFLRGTMLSNVNPKAMGCYNGKWPID